MLNTELFLYLFELSMPLTIHNIWFVFGAVDYLDETNMSESNEFALDIKLQLMYDFRSKFLKKKTNINLSI